MYILINLNINFGELETQVLMFMNEYFREHLEEFLVTCEKVSDTLIFVINKS